MKIRVLRLGIVATVVTVAWLVFMVPLIMAGSLPRAFTSANTAAGEGSENMGIFERRRISIPYGIDAPLLLAEGGQQVHVTGHGTCPEGSDTFRIRVTVTQADTSAPAQSPFSDEMECTAFPEPPPQQTWDEWAVVAEVPGLNTLEVGEAEVCITVLFKEQQGPTTVFKWCYEDVQLE